MAEDNNNIETLSYKVSIDTSDVTKAEERIRGLAGASKELKDEFGKPIKTGIDVESVERGVAVYKRLGDAAKQAGNAIKNNNIGRLTTDMQNLSKAAEQVKMNYQGIEKLLHGLDKGGFDRIAQEVDGWINDYKRNGGEKNIVSIQEMMGRWSKSTGASRGSKEWQAFHQDYIKKAAAEVYKLGGSIETIQRLASKPLGAKSIDKATSGIKALGTATEKVAATFENLKKAIGNLDAKGVNALTKEMSQNLKAQGDDSFAQIMKNKDLTKDDRIDYLAFEAENMYKMGGQLKSLPQFNEPIQSQVQPKAKEQPKEQMQEPTQPQSKWTSRGMENLKQYWTNRAVASKRAEMKNQMLSEDELRKIFNYTMKEVRLADGTEYRGGSHETERSKAIKEVQQSHKNDIKEAENAQKTIERYNNEAAKALESLKQKAQQAKEFAKNIQTWQSEYKAAEQKSLKKNKGKAPTELSEDERRKLLSQASGHRIGDRNYTNTIRHLEDKYSNQIDSLIGRDKYDAASESEQIQMLANMAKAEKKIKDDENKVKRDAQRERRAAAKQEKKEAEEKAEAERKAAEAKAEAQKKAAEEQIQTQQKTTEASTKSANEQVKAQEKVAEASTKSANEQVKAQEKVAKTNKKVTEEQRKTQQPTVTSKEAERAARENLRKKIYSSSESQLDKYDKIATDFINSKRGNRAPTPLLDWHNTADFQPPPGTPKWEPPTMKDALIKKIQEVQQLGGVIEGLNDKEVESTKKVVQEANAKAEANKKAAEEQIQAQQAVTQDSIDSANKQVKAQKQVANATEQVTEKTANATGKGNGTKKLADDMQNFSQKTATANVSVKDLQERIKKMSSKEIDELAVKVDKFKNDNSKEGQARPLTVEERARYMSDYDPPKGSDMWYDNKREVLLGDVKQIAEMKGGLEALGLASKESANEEVKATEEATEKKTKSRKKAAEETKESAKEEAQAEKSAAQEGEEAAKKSSRGKSQAKKKSAEEGAKAAQDEADAEKKAAKDSEEASKKSSEAKSRRRRKAAEDNAKSDDEETKAIKKRQSAMDKLHAQALRDDKHIASLKKKYEDLGRTRQLNLESAPHNGTATGWATYEKRRLQEEDIRKELASYGIDRPARYTPYDEYRKAFDVNSSRAQEAARKEEEAGMKRIADATKNVINQKMKLEAQDARAAKEAQKRALREDKHVASLKKKYEDLGATLQRNLDSASHNGTATSWATYDKRRAQEEELRKELASYGIDRPARYTGYEDYRKAFDANSSRAQEAARRQEEKVMRTLGQLRQRMAKEMSSAQAQEAKDTKAAETALTSYMKLRDKYVQSIESGRGMNHGAFQELQLKAAGYEEFFKENGIAFQPFQRVENVDQLNQAAKARKELLGAEKDMEKVFSRQNALISRGKQLTIEQYQELKTAGEEARKRAQAAGSKSDMQMPFNSEQYSTIEKYNREMIARNAMSWQGQTVDSYSSAINRLKHAQESLFAVYQRDPQPKYLSMLSKTRAELSRVTKEFKEYQEQINDTGTQYDRFMMRARSHLEWIASGAMLAALFEIPMRFESTLENIEAKMAGIKQVIPMIEGLEDNQYGTVRQQVQRAKQETEELLNVASKYGATVDEVMEATRSIGRMYGQGENGVVNTNLMVSQATRMAVADAFEVVDATRGLESAMSQWNLQTENTQELLVNTNRILDVWTKTAHRGAASAQDIADAIQLAGTAANQAGVSFEFFNALVATGVRATARTGNEIGTSLKSMMVSMQTEKAEKALKQWGISLKEVGTDGVERMRNLEDVILDVSMLLKSTEKDTSKLLLALSGGKFQYSKVSAILKNGDELLRMLAEINDTSTAGFTTEQIKVQLDTLSRKVNTLKDDLQGLAFNIGGLDTLKGFATHLDNVVVGLSKLSKGLGGNSLAVVTWAVKLYAAYKVLRYGITQIRVMIEVAKALKTATLASATAETTAANMVKSAFARKIETLAVARLARMGYTIEEAKAMVASANETKAEIAESGAHTKNTVAVKTETAALRENTAAKTGNAIASTGQAAGQAAGTIGAMGNAMGKMGQTAGLVSGALAIFGGEIGMIVTLLSIAIPAIYTWSAYIGEAENELKRTAETQGEGVAKTVQQLEQVARQADLVTRLAKAYNRGLDSLKECTEGTEEYTKKQKFLEDIKKSMISILKKEAVQFDETGHVQLDTINKVAEKEAEHYMEKLEKDKGNIENEKAKTQVYLDKAQARMDSLKAEMEVIKANGRAWDWLTKMRNSAIEGLCTGLKALSNINIPDVIAKSMGKKGFFDSVGDELVQIAKDEALGKNGDPDAIQKEIENIEDEIAKYQDVITQYNGSLITIEEKLNAKTLNDLENNPSDGGIIEPKDDEEGGSGGRGSGGSGSGGKSRLPYESDELAAAIHEAAQTQYAKDNSLTEPLLRGLADVQSGLSQDFNDGVRVGAFGVTEEMGKRFGQDVYTPIGNAMTAVLALTQKISDAGGDMGAALNSFTGGNASGVYTAMRAQQDAYNYDGTDYIGSSDFGNDVIAAARQRLGLPYGGGDLSDEFQTVCTTFIQRALVDAGADEAIVRSLTADASNWSTQAGAAFHSYGDGYAPKPGDVAITNIHPEDNGHGWHVVLVDENGTGYYSAGGKAGESAHYDTPIETAFEDDIEGYIDIAALTGKTRGLGLRSKGSNARKSVFDFRRNSYEQLMYQIQKAKEDYEDEAKDIELERAMTGDSYELAAREQLNEQAKLTVEQNSLKLMEAMYKGVQKSIENTIKNAPDLQVALGQEGAKWADLVPEEKKQLASLYKNDNGVFAELVNEEIKLHDALREQAKVVKEQTLKANKYLHMSIEEAAKFESNRLQMKYENFEAGLPDDNESFYLNHVESNRAKQEMLKGQIAAQTTWRDYAYNQYSQSVAKDQAQIAKVQAEIQAAKEHLALLQQEAEGGRDVTSAIQAQEQELTNLISSYDVLSRIGSPETMRLEETFYKADTAVKQLQKDLDKVAKQDLQNVRNYGAQMFTDLIVEGKSFEDVWQSLWKDLARYTINAIFQANNSGNIWGSIFSWFGGGKATGGGLAHGGRIPGYAQGGGMIKGAGTGTSDSILAYLANKDKFVYLSNGEYVMTAEATKRIGTENLDALNGYADGGAIAPTPYVPTLSNRASKRAGALSYRNPNARMEQLMQEQTSVIQNLSSGGNGQVVVLNTKASSADVLKAMQENPRQVQAILGQQRRAGFR